MTSLLTKQYAVYLGFGFGEPEKVSGPFDTFRDAEDWIEENGYFNDDRVFIDDVDFAYEN